MNSLFDVFPIKNDAQVVCSERGKKYIAINEERFNYRMIHIDGDLFSDKDEIKRCDYGFIVDKQHPFHDLYLVELKGSDITKAADQLMSSHEFFTSQGFKKDRYHFRVVSSKVNNLLMNHTSFKHLKKIPNSDYEIKAKEMIEHW